MLLALLLPVAGSLAVPSDGSNPMQRKTGVLSVDIPQPCSTLRRVEPYATSVRHERTNAPLSLQYPQTGRTLCNLQWIPSALCLMRLQYPQTGRTLCNLILLAT